MSLRRLIVSRGLRCWAALLAMAVAGCGDLGETAGIGALATGASVAVFGRAVPDLIISAASGKDCSVVRLEQGKTYCKPVEPPPPPQPVCTRSLGTVDCWTNPAALPPGTPQVADGPTTLTPEQEANRTRRWPPL